MGLLNGVNKMKVNDIVFLRNGHEAKIIYESKFGKLLLVELNPAEEEPIIHWHNADGSFYADSESELDIISLS